MECNNNVWYDNILIIALCVCQMYTTGYNNNYSVSCALTSHFMIINYYASARKHARTDIAVSLMLRINKTMEKKCLAL